MASQRASSRSVSFVAPSISVGRRCPSNRPALPGCSSRASAVSGLSENGPDFLVSVARFAPFAAFASSVALAALAALVPAAALSSSPAPKVSARLLATSRAMLKSSLASPACCAAASGALVSSAPCRAFAAFCCRVSLASASFSACSTLLFQLLKLAKSSAPDPAPPVDAFVCPRSKSPVAASQACRAS